jgi:3'-phosphoadenosine 5'-phosphosulfate (PAPS) 3'-phosphatase
MNAMNYTDLKNSLEKIVKKAGSYMLGATERSSTEKTNAKDFVTIADIKSQHLLEKELGAAFPGIVVVSEEAPFTSATILAGNPTLIATLQKIFSQLDPELLT